MENRLQKVRIVTCKLQNTDLLFSSPVSSLLARISFVSQVYLLHVNFQLHVLVAFFFFLPQMSISLLLGQLSPDIPTKQNTSNQSSSKILNTTFISSYTSFSPPLYILQRKSQRIAHLRCHYCSKIFQYGILSFKLGCKLALSLLQLTSSRHIFFHIFIRPIQCHSSYKSHKEDHIYVMPVLSLMSIGP